MNLGVRPMSWGSFYKHGLPLIPEWICNHIFCILGNVTTSQNSTADILFVLLYTDIGFGSKMEESNQFCLLSCSLRNCITSGSSFLSYSTSGFLCSQAANITSCSPISDTGGNSSISSRILWYPSFIVVILSIYENDCFIEHCADVCIWYLMHSVL